MRTVIGIDPDQEKSGLAIVDSNGNVSLHTLPFVDIISKIISISLETICQFTVAVEAGWLNEKSAFALNPRGRKSIPTSEALIATRIAKNVGANQEVGRLIIEHCKHYGIDVVEVKPLSKIWANGKISHDELKAFTGHNYKHTNQEQRDACLIAWNYLGLPIKLTGKMNLKVKL